MPKFSPASALLSSLPPTAASGTGPRGAMSRVWENSSFNLGRGKSHPCSSPKRFPALSPSLKTCLFLGSHPRANLPHAPHRGSLSPYPSPIPRSRRTHEPPDGGGTAGTGRAGCATPSPGRHGPVPARAARPRAAAGAPSGGFLAGDRTPLGPLLRQVSSSGGTRPRFPGSGCGAALEGFRRINRATLGFPRDKLGAGIST